MAKWALKIAKHAAIGGAAGFVTGRVVSTANDAPAGGRTGTAMGAAVGAATGLPFGRLAKHAATASAIYGRGLKATPGSKAGAALRAADKGLRHGKIIFRRIRGRIVRIRAK